MSWRVGHKVPLNVYDNDRPVCQCHTEEDAKAIVEAMRDRERLNELETFVREHAEQLHVDSTKGTNAALEFGSRIMTHSLRGAIDELGKGNL